MDLFNRKPGKNKPADDALQMNPDGVRSNQLTVEELTEGRAVITVIEKMLQGMSDKDGVTLVLALPSDLWRRYTHLGAGHIQQLTDALRHTIKDKYRSIRSSVIVTHSPGPGNGDSEDPPVHLLAFPFHSGFADYNEKPEFKIEYSLDGESFQPAPEYPVFNENGVLSLPCGLFQAQQILWIARDGNALVTDCTGQSFRLPENFLVVRRTPDGGITVNGIRAERSSEGVFHSVVAPYNETNSEQIDAHAANSPKTDVDTDEIPTIPDSYYGEPKAINDVQKAVTLRFSPVKSSRKSPKPAQQETLLQWVGVALPEGPEKWCLTLSPAQEVKWDGARFDHSEGIEFYPCPTIDCSKYRINRICRIPDSGTAVPIADDSTLDIGQLGAGFKLEGLASRSTVEGAAKHLGNYYCSRHALTLRRQGERFVMEDLNAHSTVQALDSRLRVIDAPVDGGYLLVGCYLLQIGLPQDELEPLADSQSAVEPEQPSAGKEKERPDSAKKPPNPPVKKEKSFVPSEYVPPAFAHLQWCGIVAHRGPSIRSWRIDAEVSDLLDCDSEGRCVLSGNLEQITVNDIVLEDQLTMADIRFTKQRMAGPFDLVLFSATGNDSKYKSIRLNQRPVELGKTSNVLQAIHLRCDNKAELSDDSPIQYHAYSYRTHHCLIEREQETYRVTEIEKDEAPMWLYDEHFNPSTSLQNQGYLQIGIYLFRLQVAASS